MNEGLGTVLIVDDDMVLLDALEQWLSLSGFTTHVAPSAAAALELITRAAFDAVLSDVRMPGMDGLALMHTLSGRYPGLPIVLLTGHGDVPLAVEALKQGAFDFLTKPHDPVRLVSTLRNACAQQRLRQRLQAIQSGQAGSDPVSIRLIGRCEPMQRLQDAVRVLLHAPLDVLLQGETGVGKERVARTLHDCGPRASKPFVAINCAAIPAQTLEAELFGQETDTGQSRIGKFEFADGGTVFLDEVECLPAPAQARLLRVLQERVVERVGSHQAVPIDVRIVSAAKADLKIMARDGSFRDDLYYRLAGFELEIPPLRLRGDDIITLFQHFAAEAGARAGRTAKPLPPLGVLALLEHNWPGNVRELRLVAERYGLGLGLEIDRMRCDDLVSAGRPSLETLVDAYERRIIIATLNETGGSVVQALERLGMPRRTLNDKMRRLGISRPRDEQ